MAPLRLPLIICVLVLSVFVFNFSQLTPVYNTITLVITIRLIQKYFEFVLLEGPGTILTRPAYGKTIFEFSFCSFVTTYTSDLLNFAHSLWRTTFFERFSALEHLFLHCISSSIRVRLYDPLFALVIFVSSLSRVCHDL